MIISLLLLIITYLIAVAIRNNGIVDIAWGLGFILIAWSLYDPTSPSSILITLLTTIWGLRLALHITNRNWGRGEDFRYAQWRKDWGKGWVIRSFFQIYLLQWVLMQIVATPIYFSSFSSVSSTFYNIIGVAIWLIGFFYEAVGDYQLTVFKKRKANKGKLMTTGLWSTTRHPNYFGEATLWWGIALIAYGSTNDILVFLGPLMIDFLLLYVSGIPMLEKKYLGRKDWEKYASKTPAFFPKFDIL